MKLISCLFALAAIAAPLSAFAELSFTEGEVLGHMLSVCVDKKDAIEILKADEERGFEAASEVWMAKDKCASVPVQGLTVGKVVATGKVKRNDVEATASVVEILQDGEVKAYFLTTAPVKAPTKGVDGKALTLKPERNA